mmetsp:Transcript_16655/g.38446  ORF Transcript_16655/g.38446 Transcript_16655/m.38446 type:complete len:101 (-) Transcript_16655:84-386(-)
MTTKSSDNFVKGQANDCWVVQYTTREFVFLRHHDYYLSTFANKNSGGIKSYLPFMALSDIGLVLAFVTNRTIFNEILKFDIVSSIISEVFAFCTYISKSS